MSPNAKKLFDAALQLSEIERCELAGSLIDSLDPEVDDQLDESWDVEIAKRLAEVESGAVIPIGWSEARQMIFGSPNDEAQS